MINNPFITNLQIHDEKSATQIGFFTYNLSALLVTSDLEIKLQPFDLQKSGSESKIVLSMALKVSYRM